MVDLQAPLIAGVLFLFHQTVPGHGGDDLVDGGMGQVQLAGEFGEGLAVLLIQSHEGGEPSGRDVRGIGLRPEHQR